MKNNVTNNLNRRFSAAIQSLTFLVILGISLLSCNHYKASTTLLFIGSYTEGKPAKGMYVYNFNTNTGKLTLSDAVDSIVNPSFLTLSPN